MFNFVNLTKCQYAFAYLHIGNCANVNGYTTMFSTLLRIITFISFSYGRGGTAGCVCVCVWGGGGGGGGGS